MSALAPLLKALDSAHWELSEALKDLPDADVWNRAHPRLLSVGELAAHIGYGEAQSFLVADFSSPFLRQDVRYYPYTVDSQVNLNMTGADLQAELTRIHEACKEAIDAVSPAPEDPSPFREGWTWGYVVEYMAFHVAYHTGQIYSVRHMLGHETVDN